MTEIKWSNKPKIDELRLTDVFMRRVPTGGANQNQEISMNDISNFLLGSFIVNVATEADLPPLLGGFHQLEQDKNYHFTEAFELANPIIIPAGWTGRIVKSFFSTQTLNYTGTTPMFQTLNIDGIIDSISDAGGGAITVTLSAAHGLIDGQYVNITGTTSYNQNGLVISNASGSVFDVQIADVGDESGAFNTGFGSILFVDWDNLGNTSTEFMDLTSAGIPGTVIGFNVFLAVGFAGMGIIRNAVNVLSFNCIFGSITSGLVLENCRTVALSVTSFADLAAVPGVTALTLTGVLTNRVTVLNSEFLMGQSTQFPVRIDGTITNAIEIRFADSPDNNVAVDYFDTTSGGLDQTNSQVKSSNNGTRPDSMVISESSSVGVLEVDGSGGGTVPVPIVDVTPASGDWSKDPTTETFSVDTTTGVVTYNGLNPIVMPIKYSLSAAQTGGVAQSVNVILNINGTPQVKSTIAITTAGVGDFIPGVYNGGNYTLNPGDTFQLFKENTTNTTNTDIEKAILLFG